MSEPQTPAERRQRLQVSSRGRSIAPTSNAESEDVPEFESFMGPLTPRGTGFLSEFLDIWDLDLLKDVRDINKQQHNTAIYSNDNLIVRRGQEFQIKITFNRAYRPADDQFAVEFVLGSSPQSSKGTYIPVFPSEERNTSWKGRVVDTADNILTMGITPTADSIVGKYRLYVAVLTPFGIRRTRRDPNLDIYVLFNPWAKEDSVFLEDEAEREECVMNDVGIIYHGAYDDISERNWSFGQFEFGILDACLFIMDKGALPITNRGDPVKIARKASAMLNCRDDDGVLVGNWSGDYMYGVAPTSWTGSVEIFLNYANGGLPVCYAQCWVYAAIFNTFLRCLGIPARVVTNYFSAHDNDGNLKMDIILDENGKVDRERTKDSIWNYHCWNECFMSRPDLPDGFGGWQVVDATPQETSDGMYRCGPASVHAIKHGLICYPFDSSFVFAEVNSDVVFYQRNRDGSLVPVRKNTKHVGRLVLTKALGSNGRREITDAYKFPEGSAEERTVLEKAEQYGCQRQRVEPPPADMELILPALEVRVGDDFELTLELKNHSEQHRTLDVYVSGSVVFYTGVPSAEVIFKNPTLSVEPQSVTRKVIEVHANDYMMKLVEQANLHFIVTGKAKETGQIVTAMLTVAMRKPKLIVKVSGSPRVREEMFVTVEFTNDFKFDLKDVDVRVEGPGVMTPHRKIHRLIAAGTTMSWTQSFSPWRVGPSKLVASLDCAALRQVSGDADVTIQS
ncbi:coagulation factor XIII A chain [Clupea harengus]|uniref:protein-glutamine gamma-glutamyltransferase n=1 Tax=Clupea harengus TaxID=7950 RepID=A0A6P8GNA8_CLUHA|nr:coagulation factor XIII A chain [Clupea harengus]XP_031440695.1 coagulation factor XIII A chain [Clupea harengus]XP_031440696.1 coagulation factor XIII A chain [Clupea harengus]